MISIAWGLSLLWLVPIFSWPYVFNEGERYVPYDKCNTEYDKNIVFKVTTAIINFYVPLIVLISINTNIFLVIRSRYRNPIMKYSSAAPKSIFYQSVKKNSMPKLNTISLNNNQLSNNVQQQTITDSGSSKSNKSGERKYSQSNFSTTAATAAVDKSYQNAYEPKETEVNPKALTESTVSLFSATNTNTPTITNNNTNTTTAVNSTNRSFHKKKKLNFFTCLNSSQRNSKRSNRLG